MTIKHPLCKYPGKAIILPPAYCGDIIRFALISAHSTVIIDGWSRFNKRHKSTHRCTIAGPNGVQRLTVPVTKPLQWHTTSLADVEVSTHGDWWLVHWGALEAAYGRTPFFEYYADDLRGAFNGHITALVDLDAMIDRFAIHALGLTDVSYHVMNSMPEADSLPPLSGIGINDLALDHEIPYYQIWQNRFGFQSGLSILDLIFNMGPEAPLYLARYFK